MTHETPLPECKQAIEALQHEISEHKKESMPVRDTIVKNTQQIVTLEKAHEQNMYAIKDIQDDIKIIKDSISGIKIWMLGGILGGILAVSASICGAFVYAGMQTRQIDINTRRLDKIEATLFQHDTVIKAQQPDR